LVLLHNWITLTIDFVLAYPQAEVKSETYIKLSGGINFGPNISTTIHVLKLLKNIYGLKQAGCVWNKDVHQGLLHYRSNLGKSNYLQKSTRPAYAVHQCT